MPLDTKKVREIMESMKLHQRDLASMCGVTEAAMSRYLSGERQPKSEILSNMATALRTTSNCLLGMKKDENVEDLISLVARSATSITPEVKMKLIEILVSSPDKQLK